MKGGKGLPKLVVGKISMEKGMLLELSGKRSWAEGGKERSGEDAVKAKDGAWGAELF